MSLLFDEKSNLSRLYYELIRVFDNSYQCMDGSLFWAILNAYDIQACSMLANAIILKKRSNCATMICFSPLEMIS